MKKDSNDETKEGMDGFYRPDFSAKVQKLSLDNKQESDHVDAGRGSESTKQELYVIDSVDSIPAVPGEAVNFRDAERLGNTTKNLKDKSKRTKLNPHSGYQLKANIAGILASVPLEQIIAREQ